jgi:predicted TIM-barrel fold metal-dependent hydrolase
MSLLSPKELAQLTGAETGSYASPIPTQVVASEEFFPVPQTAQQRKVEARMNDLADDYARRNGLSRRRFFKTAAGMATAFAAMNDVYGELYGVSRAEAASVDIAAQRAQALSGQFVFDGHTHFLRDDTRITAFVDMRKAVGKAGWNPELAGKEQTIEDLKYANWKKEIFMDSDTKVAIITSAPSDIPADWFLTNAMAAAAREKVNGEAGSRRLLAHAIFTPGQPGWLDHVDRDIETMKPDSWKGYTIGDNTHKDISRYPWRLDDEKVTYPFYEKILKAGQNIVCVHKGLFPPSLARQFPNLLPYCDVGDVGKAAKDWPQINFVIYHSGYRWAGAPVADAWAQFQQSGRVEWVSDLADIPAKYGVKNVYGDLGQIFALTTVSEPRIAATMMGQLVKGLGVDHVVWGTDAVWTGAPQWQIEALRRLEIPEDMQKKFGFAPLGPADGPVKTAIFGENSARLYNYDVKKAGLENDRFAAAKTEYERQGRDPSNLRYGYVLKGSSLG